MTMNLDSEYSVRKRADSPRTLSLASGFETQDTVGGHSDAETPVSNNDKVNTAIKETEIVDSSDDDDPFVAAEGELLKKI